MHRSSNMQFKNYEIYYHKSFCCCTSKFIIDSKNQKCALELCFCRLKLICWCCKLHTLLSTRLMNFLLIYLTKHAIKSIIHTECVYVKLVLSRNEALLAPSTQQQHQNNKFAWGKYILLCCAHWKWHNQLFKRKFNNNKCINRE